MKSPQPSTSKQSESARKLVHVRYDPVAEVQIITASGDVMTEPREISTGVVSALKSRASKSTRMGQPITVRSVLTSLLASKWIAASLLLLLISNGIYLFAFVTNSWGKITVGPEVAWNRTSPRPPTPSANGSVTSLPALLTSSSTPVPGETVYWNFGLWQSCRSSDGLCTGTRFPLFYSATRTLCVLALFFNCLSFSWMLGHTLEQLLDIDQCTMTMLAILCFTAGTFTLMAVCIFGTRWTVEFQFEHHAIDSRLDYSFYTVIAVVPLDYIAGILVIIDLQTSKILLENKFYIPKKASDGDSDDEEQDYADSMVVGSSHKRVHLWDKPDPQSVQNLTMKKNPNTKSVENWFKKEAKRNPEAAV